MKKTKRLFSLLLTLMMVLALAVPALATSDGTGGTENGNTAATGSITINSADGDANHQFYAYQIFKGTLNEEENTLSDIEWGDGVSTNTTIGSQNLLDTIKAIKVEDAAPFADCQTAADVADVLNQEENNSLIAVKFAEAVKQYISAEALKIEAVSGNSGVYTKDDVPVGYYLIIDKAEKDDVKKASDLLLRLVGEVTIDAKVALATVDKYAGENTLADNTAYGVGDNIPYTLVGTLPADFNPDTASNYLYKFVDIMEEELELTNVQYVQDEENGGATEIISSGVVVKLDDKDVTSDFAITYTGHTLTIVNQSLEKLADISKDSKIIVTYEAKLVAMPEDSNGISNTVQLTYEVGSQTTVIEETVFPVNLTIQKVDGKDNNVLLTGAVFQLSRTDTKNGKNVTEYLSITNNGMTWIEDSADETTYLTTENGLIELNGLPLGEYKLTEIEAPDGYNKLEEAVALNINGTVGTSNTTGKLELKELSFTVDGVAGTVDATTSTVTATIENNQGAQLPSTGGIGTTIFYVIGGILVLGAAVLLITRKRMDRE